MEVLVYTMTDEEYAQEPAGTPRVCHRAQLAELVYSHRNGEPDHPTEQGYYWIQVKARETIIVDYYRGNGSWEFAYGDHGDRFWGPLIAPEGLRT